MTTLDTELLKELDALGTQLTDKYESISRLPSGSLSLDFCLNGGYPRGRTTVIGGTYGSGKTNLMLLAAVETKQRGGLVAVLDIERRWNIEYAYQSGLGVPGKDYLLLYPKHEEGALETIRALARKGQVDLCILDSIAALSPKSEIEGDLEDKNRALVARTLGQYFRASANEIADSGMAVVMTNQERTGMGTGFTYIVRPGGKAKDFWASVAIDVFKPDEFEYESEEDKNKKQNPIGMTIQGKSWKNVVGPNYVPFSVEVRFYPGLHTNRPAEIYDFGVQMGILTKEDGLPIKSASAKCFFNGEKLGTGKQAIINAIAEDLDMQQAMEEAIRSAIISRQGVFSANGTE